MRVRRSGGRATSDCLVESFVWICGRVADDRWECQAPVMDQPGGWECAGAWHVLCCMWMVLPNQAGSLQGPHGASRDVLAVEDLGIGSGWPQNKQNWALPAVMGSWIRMEHSCLCCVQSTPPPAASVPSIAPILGKLEFGSLVIAGPSSFADRCPPFSFGLQS